MKKPIKLYPEYAIWSAMKYRCSNPNDKKYKNYGGRGIKVCEDWCNAFANFIKDMGWRPSPKHSIDRIDSNGNYEPNNCRWATKEIQARNMLNNVYIDIGKNSPTIAQDACDLYGISPNSIYQRMKRYGYSYQEAFNETVLMSGYRPNE